MCKKETSISGFETKMFAEETKSFKPIRIGEEDGRQSWETQEYYTQLLEAANTLRPEIEKCLQKSISIDEFFNFLTCDPENWIYKEYIRLKKINFKGLDTERIIELKLIAIDGVNDVLAVHKTFISALNKVKEKNFFFPLRKLYDKESDQFEQNVEFWQSCDDHYSHFTQTDEQNRILDIFKRLTDVLNELDTEGILRSKHGVYEIALLSEYINISKTSTIPFIVSNVLFKRNRTSKYRVKESIKKSYSFAELFH